MPASKKYGGVKSTMSKCYFELRKQSARGTDSIAADIMRHLHARQHLGKAVVLCDQPAAMLAASRKQWLKLTRTIQRQRSSTLNADKILKYTHAITRMQHMRFSTKPPLDELEAEVYFLSVAAQPALPSHCYSLYLTNSLPEQVVPALLEQLPAEALVIDYAHTQSWAGMGLSPKIELEQRVAHDWGQVRKFLAAHAIEAKDLAQSSTLDIELMDNVLDTLLGVSHQFLRVANEFQRSLELARPLRLGQSTRQEYDAVALLAYRIQALSPGAFTQRFLETYNEDDTFFLYDRGGRRLLPGGEPLAATITRHVAAGRIRLAEAFRTVYS